MFRVLENRHITASSSGRGGYSVILLLRSFRVLRLELDITVHMNSIIHSMLLISISFLFLLPPLALFTFSAKDPLRQLTKSLYDIYDKSVELMWDASKFGIPNVDASFFLTFSNVNEIIAGDKCLNIAILQLWMM